MATNLDGLWEMREKFVRQKFPVPDLRWFDLVTGDNFIRILPGIARDVPEGWDRSKGTIPLQVTLAHKCPYPVGRIVFCLRTYSPSANCPLCRFTSSLYNSPGDILRNQASGLRSKRKWLCNVLVYDDPRISVGQPYLFLFGAQIEGQIFALTGCFPEKKSSEQVSRFSPVQKPVGDIFDRVKGRDLRIHMKDVKDRCSFSSSELFYTVTVADEPSPIAETKEEREKIMAQAYSLTETILRGQMSVDEMEQLVKELSVSAKDGTLSMPSSALDESVKADEEESVRGFKNARRPTKIQLPEEEEDEIESSSAADEIPF